MFDYSGVFKEKLSFVSLWMGAIARATIARSESPYEGFPHAVMALVDILIDPPMAGDIDDDTGLEVSMIKSQVAHYMESEEWLNDLQAAIDQYEEPYTVKVKGVTREPTYTMAPKCTKREIEVLRYDVLLRYISQTIATSGFGLTSRMLPQGTSSY